MQARGIELQAAVKVVGGMCRDCIDSFLNLRSELPSWGANMDAAVNMYVDGLQSWIVGSLNWSFESHRYFGQDDLKIRLTRVVNLN